MIQTTIINPTTTNPRIADYQFCLTIATTTAILTIPKQKIEITCSICRRAEMFSIIFNLYNLSSQKTLSQP